MQPSLPAPEARYFDVLIVGGGAAGLYAALSLPQGLSVGLISKEALSLSASGWAQGGIAAALDSSDSPHLHAEDTLAAGAGLCEPAAVRFLVEQAPAQVKVLLEMGIAFDRSADGLAFTLEAAHSRPRVLHSADTTGKALIQTLTHQVWQRENIKIFSDAFTLGLWTHPKTQVCQGICAMMASEILWLKAPRVILATGGGGQVYAQTTNPALSTGDGVAIAWRAGAVLRDLEFFQFHPTALTVEGAPRFLISEAVRGEGAHLIDAEQRRFMFDYHPLGELAPRDVVSRSIFMHLQKMGKHSKAAALENVWLDLRPIDPEKVRRRFPKIMQVCQKWGIDVFSQPIPVAPAAHYWMGGIVTDLDGQTTIPGLYAVGEVASTGVHGANRLASNSLLECLVFGAQFSTLEPLQLPEGDEKIHSALSPAWSDIDWDGDTSAIDRIHQEIPVLMWSNAGICRVADRLEAAIAQVKVWQEQLRQLGLTQVLTALPPGVALSLPDPTARLWIRRCAETQNLLDNAYLILKSALFRTESRGGHYRLDFPATDEAWQVHTQVEGERWMRSHPIGTTGDLGNEGVL
ncbi:L-aspartate oxidase [Altericista sp. CCNU0014]|uniref:L-aspartate oxidase n=1 Tax=Altericista sp. CCNU0014 TaxID=3082949 RepID=UPI00384D6D1B